MTTAADWTWVPQYQLFYSASTATWARVDPQTGEWTYTPASQPQEEASAGVATGYALGTNEGEREFADVGWALEADIGDASTKDKKTSRREEDIGQSTDAATLDGHHDTPHQRSAATSRQNDGSRNGTDKNGLTERNDTVISAAPISGSQFSGSSTTSKVLRLVLLKSDVLPTDASSPKVAILDSREGGYHLGRDRSASHPVLRMKEMEVSKVHALIWYGSRDEGYPRSKGEKGWWVVDCGSTHGTFLLPPSAATQTGPTRLAEPRQASLPFKLDHLTRVTIGTTTFECHLHPEWPCDACALHDTPPIPLSTSASSASRESSVPRDGESPIPLPNATGWKSTEPRKMALTSDQRKSDTRRRAGEAMRSLKAQYFAGEAGNGKNGKKGGKSG